MIIKPQFLQDETEPALGANLTMPAAPDPTDELDQVGPEQEPDILQPAQKPNALEVVPDLEADRSFLDTSHLDRDELIKALAWKARPGKGRGAAHRHRATRGPGQ